jgi:hypothetical protein
MNGPFTTATLPSVAQSSNLLQYRALFQVFTYARFKKQSAEKLVRDAMTGGVVVPFSLPQANETVLSAAVSAQSSVQGAVTPSSSVQPHPSLSPTTAAESRSQPTHVLLLPSSKCIGTLATLLADGFFNVAPLMSTVENVHGTPYRHRGECEPRDYFTLIQLLYPDCFVAEAVPRALLAMRRAEITSPHTFDGFTTATRTVSPCTSPQTSVSGPRSWRSPPAQDPPGSNSLVDDGAAAREQGSFLAEPRSDLLSSTPGLPPSPTRSTVSELILDPAHVLTSNVAPPALTSTMVPEVDPVPLTLEGTEDLLACRRSLAVVLLSSLNEALHDVQFRELERSRPMTQERKGGTVSEAAALQVSQEIFLTAKMLLMSVMTASEVWRRREWAVYKESESSACSHSTLPLPSPHAVLYELFVHDASTAAQFTKVPVEEWAWGRGTKETVQWYDRTLDNLLHSAETAGVCLDTFLQLSKTAEVQQGREVSRAPTLLLHRPCDGHPAVEFNLSFLDDFNRGVALPTMPVQLGELQLLLHPCVARKRAASSNDGGTLSSRGHELLFDAAASPTADFLQFCVTSACPPTMLQEFGDGLPAHFRHPFQELSVSERVMIKNHLEDQQLLSAFLDKNAPMLARLTLWCGGQWPPADATLRSSGNLRVTPKHREQPMDPAEIVTSSGDYELAADIKESVMFRRPFSASVGRYVREMVVLNGFDQVTLERWIHHICNDVAHDGALVAHRGTLAALVKFAALQRKWTWTSATAGLQKQYLP